MTVGFRRRIAGRRLPDFDGEHGRTACCIACIQDRIAMKQQAGQPQDLRDIDELRRILQFTEWEDP